MRALLFALFLLPATALASETGPAQVDDADTITLNGQDISFYGIDALEITQSCVLDDDSWFCGWDAANRLEEIIGGRDVTCTAVTEATEESDALYRCMAGEDDLALMMIDEGLAIVTDDTDEMYREHQAAAEEAKIGMWAGSFLEPATFRANDCGCTARKKAMQETAALLREKREAEEAAAAAAAESGASGEDATN